MPNAVAGSLMVGEAVALTNAAAFFQSDLNNLGYDSTKGSNGRVVRKKRRKLCVSDSHRRKNCYCHSYINS